MSENQDRLRPAWDTGRFPWYDRQVSEPERLSVGRWWQRRWSRRIHSRLYISSSARGPQSISPPCHPSPHSLCWLSNARCRGCFHFRTTLSTNTVASSSWRTLANVSSPPPPPSSYLSQHANGRDSNSDPLKAWLTYETACCQFGLKATIPSHVLIYSNCSIRSVNLLSFNYWLVCTQLA